LTFIEQISFSVAPAQWDAAAAFQPVYEQWICMWCCCPLAEQLDRHRGRGLTGRSGTRAYCKSVPTCIVNGFT